jgi:hypothetical protein
VRAGKENASDRPKNFLLPPTDRAVSALLDDLAERGLLATPIVMAISGLS